MTYKYMWKAFTIAAAAAIVMYVIGRVIDADYANDMWVTVWGLVILSNIYGIKYKEHDDNTKGA